MLHKHLKTKIMKQKNEKAIKTMTFQIPAELVDRMNKRIIHVSMSKNKLMNASKYLRELIEKDCKNLK